ncbi:MAG TPA: hypothetical protein VH913_14435 [Hyphomicrobiaceae bacterium]|jgi:hypothetical protein
MPSIAIPAGQRLADLRERLRAITADAALAGRLADQLAGAVLDHVERERSLVRRQLADALLPVIVRAGLSEHAYFAVWRDGDGKGEIDLDESRHALRH